MAGRPTPSLSSASVWLIILAGIAGLVVGWFLTREQARVPAQPPTQSPRIEDRTASAPLGTPRTILEPKDLSGGPVVQTTPDPARTAVADRALASIEALLLDSSALEDLNAGDIRGGMQPRTLSNRKISLAAIERVLAQPENTEVIRTRCLKVLDSLLREPWPTLKTPEADQFALVERARALTILMFASPDAAVSAYRSMPNRSVQERVSKRALHLLVTDGMDKEDAQARILDLTER